MAPAPTVKGAGDAIGDATIGCGKYLSCTSSAATLAEPGALLLAHWPSGAKCTLGVAAEEDGALDRTESARPFSARRA